MYQILTQTEKERTAMYMKCSKIELIKMLIQANKVIDSITNNVKNCDDELYQKYHRDQLTKTKL